MSDSHILNRAPLRSRKRNRKACHIAKRVLRRQPNPNLSLKRELHDLADEKASGLQLQFQIVDLLREIIVRPKQDALKLVLLRRVRSWPLPDRDVRDRLLELERDVPI